MKTPSTKSEPSAWCRAEQYGFDMSLIKESLRMTPAQRLRAHSRALALAETLREAKAKKAKDVRS